ncbi:hypothetical protein [Providencia hangzhouensis]
MKLSPRVNKTGRLSLVMPPDVARKATESIVERNLYVPGFNLPPTA